MKKDTYSIISEFKYNGKKMFIVRTIGAACVMSEDEYNRVITAERKYKQWENRKVD